MIIMTQIASAVNLILFSTVTLLDGDLTEAVPLIEQVPPQVLFLMGGLYLFTAFYHFYAFASNRRDRYYFFFGFFSLLCALYINSASTGAITSIIPIPDGIRTIIMFFIPPALFSFIDSAIRPGRRMVALLSYVAAAALVITGIAIRDFALMMLIWGVLLIVPCLYYLAASFHAFMKVCRSPSGLTLRSVVRGLVRTLPGNIFIAFMLVSLSAGTDVILALAGSSAPAITGYGLLLFTIIIALILANRAIQIHRDLERVNNEVSATVRNLREANSRLTVSESKYRTLMEEIPDAILSMDAYGNITSCNRAFLSLLGVTDAERRACTMYDFIYDEGFTGIPRRIFEEKVRQCLETGTRTQLKTLLSRCGESAFAEYSVRLEPVHFEDRIELIGIITPGIHDSMVPYLTGECAAYTIDNRIATAEELSYRLVRNLVKFTTEQELSVLRAGLREIIVNAIEHGNLGITYAEKNAALNDGTYYALLDRRRQEPGNTDKRVRIEYQLNGLRAEYVITDEGSGFDHRILREQLKAISALEAHGKGLIMAEHIFDSMEFNARGNSVRLVRDFSGSAKKQKDDPENHRGDQGVENQ